MNMTELKAKWGKYTDTNKLVTDISALLSSCGIRHTDKGICKMLDKYFTNKEPIINMLAKSKNYIGDMRIMIPADIERTINKYEVQNFINSFYNNRNISEMLLQRKDSAGKTMMDYLKVGATHLDVSKIEEITKDLSFTNTFDSYGYTRASVKMRDDFRNIINCFWSIYQSNLSKDNIKTIANYHYAGKLAEGLKTSRAFNKICCDYGVDKIADYNKLFAKYSDMVSPGIQKLDYIISVNPYDYLTMSFGHSWTSCQNIRSGGWRGGVLSYMLDRSSIITYTVEKGNNPQTSDKIHRNMIHYNDYKFIQGRIYPQANDGATNLYDVFRGLICGEMSELLELTDNKWTVEAGTAACKNVAITDGVHYKDYVCFNNCNVFYPTNKYRNSCIEIGTGGICPYCGEEIRDSCNLVHRECH